jgi:hypothetical protein
MPDRTESTDPPTSRGPWPEADEDRIFDAGAPWCINSAGHPGLDDDCPDPTRHVPADECRMLGLSVDAIEGLTGSARDLEVYAARPYLFGERREPDRSRETRFVFESVDPSTEAETRFSLSRGDALRLALHLVEVVRALDHPPRRG